VAHPVEDVVPVLLSAPPPDAGWFERVLDELGVPSDTAHTVTSIVLRPIEIVLVVVVAAAVAAIGARAIRRFLNRVSQQAVGRRDSPRAKARMATMVELLTNVFRAFIVVVAIAMILGIVGVDLTPILASATVIGATIGFGAQSLVRDYLSGFLLTMEDQFGIGDTIAVADTSGVVEGVTLRVTRVRAADGTVWYVPNGDIRLLGNHSRGWARAVVDLPLPLGVAPDLSRIEARARVIARQVAQDPRFASTCTEPPEVLGLIANDADCATVQVRLRTNPPTRDALERALREALVTGLAEEGAWDPAPSPAEPLPPGGAADAPS
jgi:small-conductance mechanosensitive channel